MSYSAWRILANQRTYCKTCNKIVSEGIIGALGDCVICEDCLEIEKKKILLEDKQESTGIWGSIGKFISSIVDGEDADPPEKPNGSIV